MKQTILMVLMMATPAAPAVGETGASVPAVASPSKESSLASQDPLIRQILHRQLTQPNGGITTAVRIATGQSIELQGPDSNAAPAEELKDALNSASTEGALAGLKPEAGLVADQGQADPAEATNAVKPSAQLKVIEKSRKDWGDEARAGIVKMDDEAETGQAD